MGQHGVKGRGQGGTEGYVHLLKGLSTQGFLKGTQGWASIKGEGEENIAPGCAGDKKKSE